MMMMISIAATVAVWLRNLHGQLLSIECYASRTGALKVRETDAEERTVLSDNLHTARRSQHRGHGRPAINLQSHSRAENAPARPDRLSALKNCFKFNRISLSPAASRPGRGRLI